LLFLIIIYKMALLPKMNIGQQVANAASAGVASAAIDGITEYTRAPFLNDQAPIGGANMSMAEILLYGAGALMTVFGGFAAITKKRIAGIGTESIGTGIGTILGTYLYENNLATMIGIRK
jgi:hypothetical protein